MQNTGLGQFFSKTALFRRFCLRFVMILALVLAALLAVPGKQQAYAEVTSLPCTTITATIHADGSLHVVERRIVEYSNDYFALTWPLKQPTNNAELQVSGVRIAQADDRKNMVSDWADLPQTHFVLQWRTEGGATQDSFAVDSPTNKVYVFKGMQNAPVKEAEAAESEDENKNEGKNKNKDERKDSAAVVADEVIPESNNAEGDEQGDAALAEQDDEAVRSPQYVLLELSYTWTNAAVAYEDTAEMSWQYVSDAWEYDSFDVEAALTLPLPQGVAALQNDNVYAWGHGPQEGSFLLSEQGVLTYEANSVIAEQFAEAHVLFPAGWVHSVPDEIKALTDDKKRLESAITQEEGWYDSSAKWRVRELNRSIVSAAICLIALLASVVAYLLWGRVHKPDYTERYLRTLPESTLHPAVAGRLWRWNHHDRIDVVSTILHLQNQGLITIEKIETSNEDSAANSAVDWRIACANTDLAQVENPFDKCVMQLLFEVVGQGNNCVLVSDVCQRGAQYAKGYVDNESEFRHLLDAAIKEQRYFDRTSKQAQRVVLTGSLLLFVVGVIWSLRVGSVFPAVFAVPSAAIMFILGNYLFRRTIVGNNLVARCKALRNWLFEFAQIGETLDDAEVDWRLLVPFANQFGAIDMVAANSIESAHAQATAESAQFAHVMQLALDKAMHDARKLLSKERSSYGGERVGKNQGSHTDASSDAHEGESNACQDDIIDF